MAAGDLCAVADVEAWGGPASSAGVDAQLGRLIAAYSGQIKAYCETDFQASTVYTETRNGNGKSEMFLARVPLSTPANPAQCTITSLQIGQQVIDAQSAFEQPGYFQPEPQILALYGHRFCRGNRNVLVSYTAGYASVPAEVAQACIEMVTVAYRRGARAGVVSQGGATTEQLRFEVVPIPASVLVTLNRFRRTVIPA